MIKVVADTQKYFQTNRLHFWRWAENGNVIEFGDGTTICYRDDLIKVLRELSSQGTPPLGCLLLILFVCREKTTTTPLRVLRYARPTEEPPIESLQEAIRFLEIVNGLPEDCKTGKKRSHLIYEVFDQPDFVFSNVQLKAAVDELDSGRLDKLILEGRSLPISRDEFERDILPLARAFKKFPTVESLELRLRSGLDEVPRPIKIDLPDSPPPDLLDQLAQDPRTAGISRLARRLVAALNIPMHSLGSGDQSYGGITDITNRGNYDKLLLSELAHDNDLLIARLVNNEALYFKREEPPDNPKRKRTILIDTTIKMWGVPRVFSLSAALALAHNKRHNELIEAYALGGEKFKEIKLDTKEGVVQSLEILDPSLHCGKALMAVVNEIPASEYNEFIFITDEKIFNSPSFHSSLIAIKEALGFILTINRDGETQFYSCRKGKTKLLNKARFDLEELLFAPVNFPNLRNEVDDPELPAFLLNKPAPLLFPKIKIKIDEPNFFITVEGVFAVNSSQRLLFIPRKENGAYEILEVIEKGVYTFGMHGGYLFIAVGHYHKKFFKIYQINSFRKVVAAINFSDEVQFVKQCVFRNHSIYIRTDHAFFMFDCGSGKIEPLYDHPTAREFFPSSHPRVGAAESIDARPYISVSYNLMYKIQELHLSKTGKLVLGNYTLEATGGNQHLRIVENVTKTEGLNYSKQVFVNKSLLRNKNVKFAKRIWKDGSEAVIDSRGFLYLKSSDRSIPKIAIVLVTGHYTTCWASDGSACGDPHFIDEELVNVIPVFDFYNRYIQRFIDKLMQS